MDMEPALRLQSPADDARPIVRVAGVPLRLPLITEHEDDVARYPVQHAGDELRWFPTSIAGLTRRSLAFLPAIPVDKRCKSAAGEISALVQSLSALCDAPGSEGLSTFINRGTWTSAESGGRGGRWHVRHRRHWPADHCEEATTWRNVAQTRRCMDYWCSRGRDRDTARATLGQGLAVSAFPRYVPV